ncbi:Uma2 family endonuclease [Thermosporothrix hazakensis]|nr:Uma2 family endonuclease [Thermosporothrix hazakensis]BBH85966.1 hypothetical protein KTC_07170 [Thermosporothrix sp. COM3]GCE45609.1 hypothetical protein KTH_04780 [Thermosporothrix hazakensis]
MAQQPHSSEIMHGVPATLEAFERLISGEQPYRYELINYDPRTRSGIIIDMTGSSWSHGELTSHFLVDLASQLRRGGPCSVQAGRHVFIPDNQPPVIPDVVVTCDLGDRKPGKKGISPLIVIEVLSPSTEHYDRTEKFERYKRCASLQVFILASQGKQQIEVYRRDTDWKQEIYEAGTIQLEVLDLELDVDMLYQGVL